MPKHTIGQASSEHESGDGVVNQNNIRQPILGLFFEKVGGDNLYEYNQRTGHQVKRDKRYYSKPYIEPDVKIRSAYTLANLIIKHFPGHGEAQVALTGLGVYIISVNANRKFLEDSCNRIRSFLIDVFSGVKVNSEPELLTQSRLQELKDAFLQLRVKFIDNKIADAIYGSDANGVHAETLFLGASGIFKNLFGIENDLIVRVIGVRRPCVDCANAYAAYNLTNVLKSSSVADGDMRLSPSGVNVGNYYCTAGSIAGYVSAVQRGLLTGEIVQREQALERISHAITADEYNFYRKYIDDNPAISTPVHTPPPSPVIKPITEPSIYVSE